jgi:hypothetical protein
LAAISEIQGEPGVKECPECRKKILWTDGSRGRLGEKGAALRIPQLGREDDRGGAKGRLGRRETSALAKTGSYGRKRSNLVVTAFHD